MQKIFFLQRFVCGMALLVLTGCGTLIEEYKAPEISLDERYFGPSGPALQQAVRREWWTDLNDPVLSDLIKRGLEQNLSIRNTVLRIRAAEAVLDANRPGSSLQGQLGVTGDATVRNSISNSAFAGGLQGSYVFDLFGAQKMRQARAEYELASEEFNLGVAKLAFVSAVSAAFIESMYLKEAAAITRTAIANQQQINAKVTKLRNAGRSTELETSRTGAELAVAKARLPQLTAGYRTQMFRIATLLAQSSSDIEADLNARKKMPKPRGLPATGVPADIIRNRPDILSAERQLAAASAGIGVSKAALYPTLSLSGAIGLDGSSGNLAANLAYPILNRRSLKADVRVAESRAEEAENTWRQTVLTALEEINVTLSDMKGWRAQLRSYERAVILRRKVYKLTLDQFDSGATTAVDVLLAEQKLTDARLSLLGAKRSYAQAWIALHVQTGQGWETAYKSNAKSP